MLGLVSGDASGYVISWAINTSSPQAIGQIETNCSVDCIACANNNVIVGDSKGHITVFTLTKLTLVASFDAHGITKPYSITSIVADLNNDSLYSADTLGYVKKFKLSEIESGCGTIYRCHDNDITSLTVINGGRHIATCGVDKTVRIWDTEEFGYYGFLNDEDGSHWSLSEGEIGEGENVKFIGKMARPFEIDKTHFTPKPKPPRPLVSSREQMMKSMRRMSIMKMSKMKSMTTVVNASLLSDSGVIANDDQNQLKKYTYEEEKDDSFDFQQFTETIDEFMNQDLNIKHANRLSEIEKSDYQIPSNNSPLLAKSDRQLQTTTRPTELINQFQNLCSKSYRGETGKLIVSSNSKPANSVTTHLKSLDVDIMKPTKRPPRVSRRNTFGGDRVPLSLNIV